MRSASHWVWWESLLRGIFPLLLLTWKVAPALACGNAVVVKPSEETPATATLLAESMQEAGIPDGVYNVVHGFGPNSAGEFLTQHPDVNAVTFTGESRNGRGDHEDRGCFGEACFVRTGREECRNRV